LERIVRVLAAPPVAVATGAGRALGGLTARTARAALERASSMVSVAVDVIDLNAILDHVDIDAIIRRVDIQALIDRVDIDTIVGRVDIGALLERVDVNEIVARIDVDALVEETDLGAVIARSTGGVASGAVDLVRRQGVGLDEAVSRLAARIRPRRLSETPEGPPGLIAGSATT
jgi:hypothetical protein